MREDETKQMTILDHIKELRNRIIKVFLALILATALGLFYGENIMQLLVAPIGGLDKVQSIEVTETIGVYMRVSLLFGFIIAFPIILYQILAFTFPGLTKKEKIYVIIFLPFASIMFLAGVAFAYLVMLPVAIPFLTSFLGINTTPRLSNYISFITNLLFWIGISFEIPLVIFFLAKIRLVTAKSLAKHWRIAIVAIAIMAAAITPTVDPINMALLMIPLMCLYILSVFLALIAVKI